jgi:hypothetical protein
MRARPCTCPRLFGGSPPFPSAPGRLSRFCFCFDFVAVDFDMALRMLLDSFWLPGESQKIARIMEAFAGSGRLATQCCNSSGADVRRRLVARF